ncbi:MAG: hypothetical protein HZA00_09265 [Nitrospinae bacterium]|nr:hypothetical protein [Nitrospinota bacterium]
MHNSQGNSGLGGVSGGSLILLRADGITGRENIHKLCLQCHADTGGQADTQHAPHGQYAPKVHSATATWNQDTHLTAIGAGGNFYPEVDATNFALSSSGQTAGLGKGHSLGLTNVTPPGGDTAITGFSCTACHDPHGTADANDQGINKFRNLRKSATNAGNNAGVTLTAGDFTSWVGGINGTNFTGVSLPGGSGAGAVAWPVISTTPTGNSADAANSNSYGGGSTGGISRWCAQCHDNWHEALTTGNLDNNSMDWHRHPVDNLLSDTTTTSGAGVTIINTANYSVTTAGQYLPVASGSGANRVFYKTNESTDKVMCLSCHFAHGGPYNDNLRWDYTSSVSSGSQNGNGVPSTRGCQLCHNR